jgi:hypothetical protein
MRKQICELQIQLDRFVWKCVIETYGLTHNYSYIVFPQERDNSNLHETIAATTSLFLLPNIKRKEVKDEEKEGGGGLGEEEEGRGSMRWWY